MNETCPTKQPTVAVRGRSFSLRVLLVVTGFAGLFAYLSYYRSAQATVEYRFKTVASSDLDSLALNFNGVTDSPYKWAYLDGSYLKSLSAFNDASANILHQQASIHNWPRQAESDTGTRPVFLEVNDPRQGEHPAKLPMFETARFSGFLGVRRAGRNLQVRIEAQVAYDRPDDDVEPRDINHPRDKIQGSLAFQGQAPEDALIFAALLDDHTYHVVLFTVKEEP